MTTPTCAKCKRVISGDDVNVAADVAYCRACNLSYKLSTLTLGGELNEGLDLSQPPAGAWRRNDGSGMVIGATHRALGGALGALGIAAFWNGIVSIFVLVATASTLQILHVPVPEWFPSPDMKCNSMGTGMTIFLWIFLTPFILIGLAMLGAFLSFLGGRTEVRIGNSEGVVFTGFGPIGYRRRFDPRRVKNVRIDDRPWRDRDNGSQRKTYVVIETSEGKLIKFGSSLKEERRKFVAAAVRHALLA